MRRLLSYMKKYRTATVLAVFCIVLETFLELIIPLIMADMVDVGIANADKAYIFEKGLRWTYPPHSYRQELCGLSY